ncbi:MAG: hypothetical protein HYU98_01145 [Deltaproteobacteria bacterium]|nr:hypothetical protein [Deltaproteobacteria bacterium]
MEKETKELVDDIKTYLEYQKMMGVKEVPKSPPPRPSPLEGEGEGGGAKSNQLVAIRSEIGDCKRCKLCKERKNIVFGVGNPNAKLMFIGEGPGADEDEQGIPFVGRAGQLLTKIIQAMGLKRDDVYIGNVVKCLRYNAMVQLGNGKWERIGRLVRNKYNGLVKSIASDGTIINKKIIGWHETALGNRSVYKLTYNSAKPAGSAVCAIYLTGDHPVLTKRGYIQTKDLRGSDLIATGQGLSKTAKKIIYGMLLGDGHITSKQTLLSFSHGMAQEDYAKFKMKTLCKEFDFRFSYNMVRAGFDKKYPIIKCWTHSYRNLRIMRHLFYDRNKKKIAPKELQYGIDPITLAVWFMDDGHMRIRPPRQPSAEIATCAFAKKDLNILVKGLKTIGLDVHILRNRIHFNTKATVKLSQIIAPYVPPHMRWNFVTTGGVVHNCRPPNNRNPEPDEIETCLPFLLKQITAIKPKIIVALGAIAAKSLLNAEIPISKIRGKVIDWEPKNINWSFSNNLSELPDCKLVPTYHPAFLLRNPNMKRPVWEDMQKVMEMMG